MKIGLRIILLVVLVVAGLWLLTTFGPGKLRPTKTTAGEDKIKVIATIFPLADIVEQIGGERVKVITLLPAGANPHTFEPTPRQMAEFSDARILVKIGAGLDFWADKMVRTAGSQNLKTIVVSKDIKLLKETCRKSEEGNPHVWLDPILTKGIVKKIEKVLTDVDPFGTDYYRKRAVNYQLEINRLDTEIRKTVSEFKVKEYVAFHSSWTYFGIRYGLKEAGVIEETPGRDPTPKQVKTIVDNIRKLGIRAVFAEPQFSSKVAETISENAGAKILFLDPLGNPDIIDRKTYLDLMRYNLKVMKEAME